MDYYLLTDLAATMGYHLAMSGAETFRVEDTIHRILRAYGVECEVFAIPNCVSVSLEAANGKPLMLMRRMIISGLPLAASRLTDTQLGMANTSHSTPYARRMRWMVSSTRNVSAPDIAR